MLFIGLLFLAIGLFDLFHMIFYHGMPFFPNEIAIACAPWMWIIARMIEGIGIAFFVIKPEFFQRKNKNFGILAAISLIIITFIVTSISGKLPKLVDEYGRMTTINIFLEYSLIIVNFITLTVLLQKYRNAPHLDSLRFLFGVFLIMIGGLFFTQHNQFYDFNNLLGHFYKALGYVSLYQAILYPHYRYILSSRELAVEKQKEAEVKLFQMEKSISQQIFEVHEDERKRISRELHDSIGQSLYSILIILNVAKQEKTMKEKDNILTSLQTVTENTMQEVREIAQSLRPSSLDDLGFLPALRAFLERYEKIYNIKTRLIVSGQLDSLSPEAETAMYRICQEALNNAAKYADPTIVEVEIKSFHTEIFLTIKDNGSGFSIEEYMKNKKRIGIGLISIKERAEGLGGEVTISSEAKKGTKIIVKIPKNIKLCS